jgi:hypothetical protein
MLLALKMCDRRHNKSDKRRKEEIRRIANEKKKKGSTRTY